MTQDNLTIDEVGDRAEAIYREQIRPKMQPEDKGKIVVVDIVSGDYELDADILEASDRMEERHPDAIMFAIRVGYKSVWEMRPAAFSPSIG